MLLLGKGRISKVEVDQVGLLRELIIITLVILRIQGANCRKEANPSLTKTQPIKKAIHVTINTSDKYL